MLPISNPANLVVFDGAMPSLGRWLAAFALPSVLSIVVTYGALRWLFRRELRGPMAGDVKAEPLSRTGALALVGLALAAVVRVIASTLHADLGLPTFVASVVVTVGVCVVAKLQPASARARDQQSTLCLVAGALRLGEEQPSGLGRSR